VSPPKIKVSYLAKPLQLLYDFVWFTGIGVSILLFLLMTLSLIPAFFSNNLEKYFVSNLVISFVALSSANNALNTPFRKFKHYTLIAEFAVLALGVALIVLMESSQFGQQIQEFFETGNLMGASKEILEIAKQLSSLAGFKEVFSTLSFYFAIIPLSVYYLIRYRVMSVTT
jgi:hypothetical protein